MTGDTDIEIARLMAERLGPGARLVEFGPWLGGVTQELCRFGEVHVVDRFLWTELNAERLPGLFQPGEDFRGEFDRLMRAHGLAPIVHPSSFRDFVWEDGAIDYCFIDAPRTARDLHDCLRPVAASLKPGAPVIIRHGANRTNAEMAALIHLLLARGDFALAEIDQPAWCNAAVLRAGRSVARLGSETWSAELLRAPPPAWSVGDPWGGEFFAAARLSLNVAEADWPGAYALLDAMPPLRRILEDWDAQEALLELSGANRDRLQVFSSILGTHHGGAVPGLTAMAKSESAALRGAWARLAGGPLRAAAFQGDTLREAWRAGGFEAVARLGVRDSDPRGDSLSGRHLMFVGRGLRPVAVAAIACGAASFLGLETSAGRGPAAELPLFGAATVTRIADYAALMDDQIDTFAVLENYPESETLRDLVSEIEARLPPRCERLRIAHD